jgi:hypothetical protein
LRIRQAETEIVRESADVMLMLLFRLQTLKNTIQRTDIVEPGRGQCVGCLTEPSPTTLERLEALCDVSELRILGGFLSIWTSNTRRFSSTRLNEVERSNL